MLGYDSGDDFENSDDYDYYLEKISESEKDYHDRYSYYLETRQSDLMPIVLPDQVLYSKEAEKITKNFIKEKLIETGVLEDCISLTEMQTYFSNFLLKQAQSFSKPEMTHFLQQELKVKVQGFMISDVYFYGIKLRQ